MVWNAHELIEARKRGMSEDTLFGKFRRLGLGDVTNRTFLTDVGGVAVDETLGLLTAGGAATPPSLAKALLFSSLPETFADSDIALLLKKTTKFTKKGAKRLATTDDQIKAILNGLDPDGHGLYLAYVNLGVRHFDLSAAHGKIPGSDIPYINQVGLAYTLLTFSYTPFYAQLRAEHTAPDPGLQLKWLTMWNVLGELIGIEKGGLPVNLAEAASLLTDIRASVPYQYVPPGQPGKELTESLIGLGYPVEMFWQWGGDDLMQHLGFAK
jgi:hypothetical protein